MTEMMPADVTPAINHQAFHLFGQPGARGPLVFSVPHAGRDYGSDLLSRARVAPAALARLEDRFADLLAAELIAQGHCVLIARRPRAMIDLNRDLREIDPQTIAGLPRHIRPQSSAKVRGGLGLIPDRLAYVGALWRHPLPYAELVRRIEQIHRPYHDVLGSALDETRTRHGTALLVDLHSMPPLRAGANDRDQPPRIVIGDRFGRTAADRLTGLAADVARDHGHRVAINTPYSGNYILERHGRPARGIHAIQVEIDRLLYLENDLMTATSAGLRAMQHMLTALAQALAQELGGSGLPLAAE